MWQVTDVEVNGAPAPKTHPAYEHFERVEQCGDRLVVTAGGVIHDMRCDGTAEHGVHDVAQVDYMTPITVVATYENGVHVLRPVGIPVEVSRRLDGEDMVWTYVGFTARLRRIADAPPTQFADQPASAGSTTTRPIACTLATADIPGRLARWQRLAAHVVERTDTDDGVRVRFDNTVSAAEVAGLAAEEHECCAFFAFTIHIATDGTTLEVGAPADARALVGMLFDQDDRQEPRPAITTT